MALEKSIIHIVKVVPPQLLSYSSGGGRENMQIYEHEIQWILWIEMPGLGTLEHLKNN